MQLLSPNHFLSEKQVKNAEYTVEKSKKEVWNDLADKWIYGNVILAGDAANQNIKPFIEGILPSIICGDIAGKKAYDACNNKKKVSHDKYFDRVQKVLHNYFITSKKMQYDVGHLFAKDGKEKYLQFFGLVTEIFKSKQIEKIDNMNYMELKMKLLQMKNEM